MPVLIGYNLNSLHLQYLTVSVSYSYC